MRFQWEKYNSMPLVNRFFNTKRQKQPAAGDFYSRDVTSLFSYLS